MAHRDDLWVLRRLLSAAREDSHPGGSSRQAVRTVIRASWQRSVEHVPPSRAAAPVEDRHLDEEWEGSRLRHPVRLLQSVLSELAREADLVVAITDPDGKILWSLSERWMRKRAERVNFVPGGRWDEASMGTNALDLALRTGRPQTVFSAEHFTTAVEDWVCYAAPVFDAAGQRTLGVLDLSTTWNRALPIGLQVATLTARHLSGLVSAEPLSGDHVTLRTLGTDAEVRIGGMPVNLPRRQIEILTLLSLHRDGLSLEALHTGLYPDLSVALTTCKAEVSKLRRALGGGIASRPYRLTAPLTADHVEVETLLGQGRIHEAARLFRGEFLPHSEAPELVERRHLLTTAMREAVLASGDAELVATLGERLPEDLELQERGLVLLPGTDPRRSLLEARRRLALR